MGGGPPARSPHASLRLGVVDLEARPGPAAAHGRRSQVHQSLRRPPHQWRLVADVWLGASSRSPARPRRRPRAPLPGPVGQAAWLSETAVTFAGAGRASAETGVAFAGEQRAFLVRFSVAVVSSVSTVAIQGRAVVMVVSSSPRHSCPCVKKFALLGLMLGVSATKFAQRAQNGPNSAFCGVLGEFSRKCQWRGGVGRTLLLRGPGSWAPLLAALTLQCAAKPHRWRGGRPAHAATYRVNVRVRGVW